jgi:tRNA G18 (ribose-2'-O)-methylase SpoU
MPVRPSGAEQCEGGKKRFCVRVRIPMPGGAESLNAGVAAGIVLYEAARRRA